MKNVVLLHTNRGGFGNFLINLLIRYQKWKKNQNLKSGGIMTQY